MSVATRLCRFVAMCLVSSQLLACLDLALPDVGADGGVGPDLDIHSPREGQTIPLEAPVNIDATSVNGVASVTVTCGGAPSTGVFSWTVAPYTGIVDFTRCTLVASGSGDAGIGQLQLTFIAVDRLGHVSTKTFPVFLDTSTAALTARLPERVVPLAPLTLTVGSDRPLLLPPTVRLANREADGIVPVPAPDGGPPTWEVTFLATPGLGIDTYTGDPFNVPFEVLSDVERTLSITVEARATNGNSSHLEQAVLLSRVLWDRAVPGRIALAAADPVATDAGVQVALARRDAVPGPTSDWLPGFFRSGDGTYVPFDPPRVRIVGASLLAADAVADDAGVPFPADAGYFATHFDGRGRVLFARPNALQQGTDILALGEPAGSGLLRAGAAYTIPVFGLVQQLPDGGVQGEALTRTDDLLCLPDVFTGSLDGCAYPAPVATQTVSCLSLPEGTFTSGTGSSSSLPLAPPNPGGTAGAHGSPRTYLSPNDIGPFCGPAWAFFALPSNLFVPQPVNDDAAFGTGCFVQGVRRIMPFASGGFAVEIDVGCGNSTGQEIVRVDPGGAVSGSYLAPQGVLLGSPPEVLAALADGTVVTMRNTPPQTTFEAWPPDGSGPSATAQVPGLYVYGGAGARLVTDLSTGSDGSLTVLLNSATLGDVVLHFGAGLKPRWLYRYPRLANSSTLVAADQEDLVYYVDPLNNALVALDRRGGGSAGAACSVNGVSVSASPASVSAGAISTLTATVTATSACAGGVSWSVSPPGGTLTPNGASATFSSPTPGTYTVTATSVADPKKSGQATVTVNAPASCGAPTGVTVTHLTTISASETWAGDGVTHSVPNTIGITGSAVVTIQPCAIVSLGAGASITVGGTAKLVAAGTAVDRSISFVPANTSVPWGALRGNSATSFIDLSWSLLQGGGALGGQGANSMITVAGPGYSVTPAPVLRVNNVTIDSPQGGGIYLDASGSFTSDSQALTIQNAPGFALSMVMMTLGSIPPGSYNATSNAHPEALVIGPNANVFADLTIHKHLPVRIQTASLTVHAPPSGGTAPVTLTVEPGSILRFPKVSANTPGARVYFGSVGNAPNDLVGALNAQGTAAEPILFTSGEVAPAPGDWAGLYLLAATGSRLDHVTVEYAGAFSGIVSANCRPTTTRDDAALIVGDATQYVPPANLLTNSIIRFSLGHGIDAIWQAATNAPDLITGNGNTVTGYAGCRQTFNGKVTGACGTFGCTVP